MRIEQLQYFTEVARYQSFTIAAGHLHISQPSISQAISALEEELNVKLFERSRAGVKLTKTGQTILKKAQSTLNMILDIYDEARAESHSMTGSLQIATIPSICNAFLSDALSIYKKRHPYVRIEVNEDGTKQIMQDVIAGRIDLGLVSSRPGDLIDNRIVFQRLLSGTYMVCIGKHSPIPLHNPMPSEVIAGEPIISFKSNYRQEEYIKQLLKTEQLNILLTIGYTEAAKKMIAKGVAIAFYPDFSIKKDPYVQSGEIFPLEIQGNDLILLFGWIHLKSKHLSKAAKEFIKVLKDVIDHQGL